MTDGERPTASHLPSGPAAGGKPFFPARATGVRWLVLGLACGLSFLLYLHRYAWGFVKNDVQKELGWGPVALGWLDSLFVASYGLGQVPAGMLCDWFGARLLLGGSVLAWSLSLAGMAVATGMLSMGAARLAFGAGQASCYPVLNKVSKNWFPPAMRTTAQGLIATLFGRAGGAASFLLVGTVLLGWLALPWRTALLVLSVLGLAAGGLFLLLFRNTPRQHPWANGAEAELVTAGDPEAAHATRSRLRWTALLGSSAALLLLLRALASNLADVFFVYWLPLYLQGVKQVDVGRTGWLAALPLLGGAVGGVFSGALQSWLLPRLGGRWARSGVGLAGKTVAAALVPVVLGLEEAGAIVAVLLTARFFSDWEQPAEWGAASDLGGRNAATLFACINTAGALGGFLGGPLIGLVLHQYSEDGSITPAGWHAVFLLIALEYLVAAVCWLFIDCRRPLGP